jgi:hypothetical protein
MAEVWKEPSMAYNAKGPIKLLGSSRGRGVLRTAAGDLIVSYQFDTYQERGRTSSSGSIDGDASAIDDGASGVLKLETGEDMDIVLIKPDEEGVDFISAPKE